MVNAHSVVVRSEDEFAADMSSQDTEATMEPPASEAAADEAVAGTEPVQDALSILNLATLPETRDELNRIIKQLLFRAHPDHNFNSAASKDFTQKILAARTILMQQYN